MELNKDNYYSNEADQAYWSVSQFKSFLTCEAQAMAKLNGEIREEPSTALLVGSLVDAYFEGSEAFALFQETHPEIRSSRGVTKGQLKSEYRQAYDMIIRAERDPFFMEHMKGQKQAIMTGELFGYPWKIKADVLNIEEGRIVDLKTTKDIKPTFSKYHLFEDFGYMPFIEAWGYHIQGYAYQEIVRQNTGMKLPFYIAYITKEAHPDIGVVEIPQAVLNEGGDIIKHLIDRFDMVKSRMIEPYRCEKCDYCKDSKVLNNYTEYSSLRRDI